MKKSYEIPVYNNEVRLAISNRQNHPSFAASWADTHLITIQAHTAEEALNICRRKHPEKLGFVLGDVSEAI
ncbi:MAG: hypothetical protein KDF58_03795 [Alphaproteobacteria bacterium]|nr:hypothetical protein [Alphaproteobacteria bacterium]HPF46851.1 hypothetical protein [Emcibacteraceae bacterium]HRW29189.1 hypothetical protein [Emcibacteraceae bacterium]